jgi:hypothetical protein
MSKAWQMSDDSAHRSTGLPARSARVASPQPLDRHGAIQPRVVGLPHLAHPTGAQWREDLIGAEYVADGELHV